MFHRTSALIGVGPFMPEEAISQPWAYQGIQFFTFWREIMSRTIVDQRASEWNEIRFGGNRRPAFHRGVLLTMRSLLPPRLFPPLTTLDSSDSLSSILWKNGRELRPKEDGLVDEKTVPEDARVGGKARHRFCRLHRRHHRRREVRHPPAVQGDEHPVGGHGPAGERQAGPVRGGRRVRGLPREGRRREAEWVSPGPLVRNVPRPREGAFGRPGEGEAAGAPGPEVLPRLPHVQSLAHERVPDDQPGGPQPDEAVLFLPQPARPDAADRSPGVLGVPC